MNSIEAMQQKLLEAKEKRQIKQTALLEEFNCTLVSFTLNTPGMVKDSPEYRRVHEEGLKTLIESAPKDAVVYVETSLKDTGPQGYICLDMRAINVKKLTVTIEEHHPLGRIFDMDVIDQRAGQLSRETLNMSPRKCLLCDKPAHECTRNRTHGMKHLVQYIDDMCQSYLEQISHDKATV